MNLDKAVAVLGGAEMRLLSRATGERPEWLDFVGRVNPSFNEQLFNGDMIEPTTEGQRVLWRVRQTLGCEQLVANARLIARHMLPPDAAHGPVPLTRDQIVELDNLAGAREDSVRAAAACRANHDGTGLQGEIVSFEIDTNTGGQKLEAPEGLEVGHLCDFWLALAGVYERDVARIDERLAFLRVSIVQAAEAEG